MKRFDDIGLWKALKTYNNTDTIITGWNRLFDDFVIALHEYCRGEKNIAEKTRSLHYAKSELAVCLECKRLDLQKQTTVKNIINQAIYFIDSELNLIKLELEYPERFISFPDDNTPLARWNGTIAELLEYTIPLQIAGRLSANSGEPMSYTDTVKLVERIFGITISAPYDRKTKLLSRKKNDTPFLDKMRIVFREEAEKLHR